MKEDLKNWIRFVYVVFIIIWSFTVWYLKLYNISVIALFILVIPYVVFISGFMEGPYASPENEIIVFEASFLAIGLLVIVPLINWTRENYTGDCKRFITISVVAIIFTLLSVLDIWLKGEYMRLNKHIRLCFETMAVTMFILLLYMYILNSDASGICGDGKRLERGDNNETDFHGLKLTSEVAPAFHPSGAIHS